MLQVELLRPASIHEASRLLSEHGDQAKVLAAGSALVLMLNHGLIAPRYLVAIDHLPDLRHIAYEPGVGLRVGALVTHRQMETDPAVQRAFPALAQTFHRVGNIRVRNQATVGGVLCEADYASDPPAMLLALGARVRAVGQAGERWIDLADFFLDFYTTALAPDEILAEVVVPEPAHPLSATYLKFTTRSSEDRPCVGVAAAVERDGGVCRRLRVVVGAATATPQAFPEYEQLAEGQPLEAAAAEALAERIAQGYAQSIDPLSDLRGSAAYRRHLVGVLVRRAILEVTSQ